MVAEDSRYTVYVSRRPLCLSVPPFSLCVLESYCSCKAHLAVFTLEDEVGLAPAAAHLVLLLGATLTAESSGFLKAVGPQRTKRLTPTQFTCVSLHDVHWTWNVYQKGVASESSGRRLVTLRWL